MGEIYSVHRRAVAHGFIEEDNLFVRVLLRQTFDEVELGANCPFAPCWRFANRLDDLFRGTNDVGIDSNFMLAFRVSYHLYP